jgi:hypothetical protein
LTADKSVLRGQIEIFYQVEPSTIIYPADSTSPACIEIQNLIYDATTTTVNILVSDLSLNNTYLDYNGGIRNPLVYKFYDILSKKTGQPIYLDMPLAQVSTEAFISKPSSFTKDMVDNLNRFQYGGMPVIAPYTSDFYLVPTGMTDRIPLPPIAENWLVSLVSRECLANIGDLASMQMLDLDIKEEKKEMESVLARRIQKEQYKLNGGNALHSFICK